MPYFKDRFNLSQYNKNKVLKMCSKPGISRGLQFLLCYSKIVIINNNPQEHLKSFMSRKDENINRLRN